MPKLSINLRANLNQFSKDLDNAARKLQQTSRKFTDIGKQMSIGFSLPIVAVSGAAFKLASDMEESLNKVDVAFKGSSDAVKEWSKTTLRAFGIERQLPYLCKKTKIISL
jgi:hypothetical protein